MDKRVLLGIGAILAVVLLIIMIELFSQHKLKLRIRYQWGKKPAWSRLDNEDSLKEAWHSAQTYQKADSIVDDITWNDLDMLEVFEAVNATYSSVGSEALYHQLRSFDFNSQSAEKMEQLITFYQNNPEMREKIQFKFAQLGKKDNNFVKHYLSTTEGKELPHFYLYMLLGLLPFTGLLFLSFGQVFGAAVSLGSICFNTVYYLIKKERMEMELSSLRYFVRTLGIAKDLSKLETPVQKKLKENLSPLKKILFVGFSFRVKSNSEAEIIFDYVNMALMLPFISYNFVLKRLARHRSEAIMLWDILGKMEMAYAVLNFRLFMPAVCQPEFARGGITATNNYHSLLYVNAVANPIDWEHNTLVTGSNASGKSTYVKSIAINCILAQTIQTVTADSFKMERGHVLTSIAIEDNIFEGDSYFVAEIKSIKRVLDQVEHGERNYCFIDEILKGTNTIERIAASASIINWLKQYPSLAFVATHDIELTEILKHSCENVHFEERVEEEGITFDYELKAGPATTRNALQLLQVMNYPDEIVTAAKEEAQFFDDYRTWKILNS
ncbi:DNA mismatch repair protein MutS [Enterococcus sp. BWT-B8]|uniref:MutS-related protein n=1 Tax=Enterococcus sp. BWT-B8 TaxID=2885157 RepID=UPI001E3CCE31|nr:DNA mismatch repair protein MutS [Enterococcus sp. BWT-B8]MCB5952201.1 DNA mismatch repair protein MutS [Enterococcus sp. BWT-B8]